MSAHRQPITLEADTLRFNPAPPVGSDTLTSTPPEAGAEPKEEPVDQPAYVKSVTGQVVYNVPENLRKSRTQGIQLVISDTKTDLELRQVIDDPGVRKGDFVRVAPRLRATLTGRAFQIDTVGPTVRSLEPGEVTQWRWQITPKEGGEQDLYLELFRLPSDSAAEPASVKSYHKRFPST